MVALPSKEIKLSRSNVASNIDLKTLGLLLKRPNIALVIVRPFRIDPYNSNDGATY